MSEPIMPRLRRLQPAAVADRLRQSLTALPMLCLVLGAALAALTTEVDSTGFASWLPNRYGAGVDAARGVLGAIAAGTITVVTLVLTLTLVAIQLAAGQLSPRTIVNFLGDRFQQATVGVVLGTATFSVVALASTSSEPSESDSLQVTVLVALGLTLASLLMLVISVDRTATRLAVGNLVEDIADETCDLVASRYRDTPPAIVSELPARLVGAQPDDGAAAETIVIDRAGWVQYIDEAALIEALPEGSDLRILHPVGTFVFGGMELLQIGIGDADELDDERTTQLRAAIVVGDHRTMQQDVAFGLTRLTDIGLRALSPGINDPNTAREVALRIGQVVLALQATELPPTERVVDGRRLSVVGEPTHDDFVRDGFDQLRRAASGDDATLRTIRRTLATIANETKRRELPGSLTELRRQIELVDDALGELGGAPPDGDARTSLP